MYVNFKVTDKKSLSRKPNIKILVKNKKKHFHPSKKNSTEKLNWINKYWYIFSI